MNEKHVAFLFLFLFLFFKTSLNMHVWVAKNTESRVWIAKNTESHIFPHWGMKVAPPWDRIQARPLANAPLLPYGSSPRSLRVM
jgi:hypothetical protein